MSRPLTFAEWQHLTPEERVRITLERRTVSDSPAAPAAGQPNRSAIASNDTVGRLVRSGGRLLDAANPGSLPAGKRGRPMMDPSPHRNRGMIPAPELSPDLLNRVIATAVAFGMPRPEAEEARTNRYVRTHVITLACMVWDAAAGDKRAKAALDRIRHAFNNAGAIAETISATEQPADGGELTKLLGADQ